MKYNFKQFYKKPVGRLSHNGIRFNKYGIYLTKSILDTLDTKYCNILFDKNKKAIGIQESNEGRKLSQAISVNGLFIHENYGLSFGKYMLKEEIKVEGLRTLVFSL